MLSSDQLNSLTESFLAESWVDPFNEFNRGYRLEPSNSRPAKHGAKIFDLSITLPIAIDFNLYILPMESITWIDDTRPMRNWISLVDYCNETGTLFTINAPNTMAVLDISKCFITLINGRYPVLITPYIGGSVDVNIRKSWSGSKLSVIPFELNDILDVQVVTDSLASPVRNYRVYYNSQYYDIASLSELPIGHSGYMVFDPNLGYINSRTISTLETYNTNDGPFYLVPMTSDPDVIHHNIDMEIHLVSTINNRGGYFDKSAFVTKVSQITANYIGVRSDYVNDVCFLLGIDIRTTKLVIHIPRSTKRVIHNSGMNRMIANSNMIPPSELMTNGSPLLDFVYANSLAKNKYNQLQMLDLANVTPTSDNFAIEDIDSALNVRQSLVSDVRTSTHVLSGKPFRKYNTGIKYSRDSVNLSEYTFPRIFTSEFKPGVFGTDYYVSEGGIVTLLNGAHIIDYNGIYELIIDRPFEIIDLTPIPFFNSPLLHMELESDGIFLHPNIDYGITPDGVIVWKEGVKSFTIRLTFNDISDCRSGWIINEEVYIPKEELYGLKERLNIFIGEECVTPDVLIPAKNGIPYSVDTTLLSLFNKDSNVGAITSERQRYLSQVDTLAVYYDAHNHTDPIEGFDSYYGLVSPMCMDVLAAIRKGDIDPDPIKINELGIEQCIPSDIMDKYNSLYDPSIGNNLGGEQFVIIKAHDESELIELNINEWNFLKHVNATFLRGRVTLEMYYRISYE